MAMGMAMAAASPSCSSPPWPASSSSTRSSRFLLHTATATRPASSSSARRLGRPRALPETALVAAGVAAAGVAAAAFLLRGDRKTDRPTSTEQGEKQAAAATTEECAACGGSGLCPRCKGEGFVFKEVGEEAAGRARRAAKNMATRYTAGLPTKWTYCNRCSSTRSCTACDGAGAVPVRAKTTTTTSS